MPIYLNPDLVIGLQVWFGLVFLAITVKLAKAWKKVYNNLKNNNND